MTKKRNIDEVAKEILRESYEGLDDPGFNERIMTKIVRQNHRQQVFDNILLALLVFVAIDTLIFLALWLTGLDILKIIAGSRIFPDELIHQASRFKDSIIGKGLVRYFFISFGTLIAILALIESGLGLHGRSEHHGH